MDISATDFAAPTSAFDRVPALTAADRCDATTDTIRTRVGLERPRVPCGAQAYVTALLPSGSTLQFCAHHGHQLECTLAEHGAVIRDVSDALRNTRSGSTI
jgi:hypothetical protein